MSEHRIKVRIQPVKNSPMLTLRWEDPVSGKTRQQSCKTDDMEKAEHMRGDLECKLNEGSYQEPSTITWEQFRERYENEAVKGLAAQTGQKIGYMFKKLETIIRPKRLVQITAERLSYFQSQLRSQELSEDTIKSYLAHLASALRWAVRMGMLPKAPSIEMPRRAKGSKMMKGRPITREEFERMLEAVPKVLTSRSRGKKLMLPDEDLVGSWRHFLEGLWLSGLRLEESLELWWDRDDKLSVDLSGEYPMLRIPAELEKGHKNRLLPIAPEFAEFLRKTPVADRTGRLFNPQARRKHTQGGIPNTNTVSKIICDIGKKAGVKVDTDPRTEKVKYASAHDFRRSFGERWASRVMPQVLMELMRHEDIQTTMKYYVGRNAERTARTLWEVHEKVGLRDTSRDTGAKDTDAENPEVDATTSRD